MDTAMISVVTAARKRTSKAGQRMNGIVIFGAGQAGMTLYRLLQRGGRRVEAFADNNRLLWHTQKEGLPVLPMEEVAALEPEEIYVAVVNETAQKEIQMLLAEQGYEGRIILLSDLKKRYNIRLATARLLAEEIRRRRVPGDIAELGVYQGAFAEELNRLFPDRTLYLFDTFSGFDERDIQAADGKMAQPGRFSDTSVQAVMARMPYPEKTVIRQGYFPDSLGEMAAETYEGRFALVSLDTDLYQPTMAGLSYFYSRVSPGGYILLDDYNSPQFPGAGKAVQEFCEREGLSVVPLCDLHGTAVLAKYGGGQ